MAESADAASRKGNALQLQVKAVPCAAAGGRRQEEGLLASEENSDGLYMFSRYLRGSHASTMTPAIRRSAKRCANVRSCASVIRVVNGVV